MICSKCNRSVPDGEKICPNCNADITLQERRCPQCWVKLDSKDTTCPKCGCDIERTIKEREEIESIEPLTFWTVVKKLPIIVKLLIPVIIIAVIVMVNINNRSKFEEMEKNVVRYSKLYDQQLTEAVEAITIIAHEYKTGVYDRDWNKQTENAQELRRVHGDEIAEIEGLREHIVHTREKLKTNGDDTVDILADNAYYAYRNCYEYVILEGGVAEAYIDNYLVLVEEFEEALKEFNEEAKKHKDK